MAIPAATDGRFKAAPFCLFAAWLITVFSLWHSIKHYCERNRGIVNRTAGLIHFTPNRFILLIPLSLVVPAYQELVSWKFEYSPLNVTGLNAAIFVGGYVPTLLILYIQSAFGYFNPNEDLELQRQRRVRGRELDQELGIVHKPSWWRRLNSEGLSGESMRDIIARNVREVGGRKPTTRTLDEEIPNQSTVEITAGQSVEMAAIPRAPSPQAADLPSSISPGDFAGDRDKASLYVGKSGTRRSERTVQTVAGLLFPGQNEGASAAAGRHAELMMDGPPTSQPPPPYINRGRSQLPDTNDRTASGRSISTNTTNTLTSPPQQIRSMLDI